MMLLASISAQHIESNFKGETQASRQEPSAIAPISSTNRMPRSAPIFLLRLYRAYTANMA